MRKVFALLLIGGMFTFASCGEKKAETSETTTTETMSSEGAMSSDSTSMGTESTTMGADSAGATMTHDSTSTTTTHSESH